MSAIQHEFSKCKVCGGKYDDKNLPYSLNCGETLCVKCKNQYTEKNIPCFFNNNHSHKGENPPINYAFKDIISLVNQLVVDYTNVTMIELMSRTMSRIIDQDKPHKAGFKKQGIDKYQCSDFTYEGHYKDGKPYGKGKLTHIKIGGTFEGTFFGDYGKGIGKINYIDKPFYLYEGEWNNFMKNGKGKLKYNNGDEFEGLFKNDEINGNGKFFDNKRQEAFIGTWRKGKKIGELKKFVEK